MVRLKLKCKFAGFRYLVIDVSDILSYSFENLRRGLAYTVSAIPWLSGEVVCFSHFIRRVSSFVCCHVQKITG